MFEFQYEVDNSVLYKSNPDKEFIITYLKQMNNKTSSFCTLSLNDHHYVQCAGEKDKMIIEYRKPHELQFYHFVLGKGSNKIENSSIKYSGGNIELKKNEILNYNDACMIFECFFEGKDFSSEYVFREISSMFL